MDFGQLIQSIALYALPVVFAITVHEAAHGYAARHFGDDTAWLLGRITLNPLKHIDPVGTVIMPLVLYFATSGSFVFGYAKPVPVRFGNLRRPKQDMVWVALAGPASNFAQAMLWAAAFIVLHGLGITEPFLVGMAKAGIAVNAVMFALNLFPLPPLDGGRILVGLLPYRQALALSRVEPWGFFIVLGLLFLGIVDQWWMRPVMQGTIVVIKSLLTPLTWLFS